MYKGILDGIFESNGITSEADKVIYLEGLKPVMNKLFNSYQNQNIRVDYSEKYIQDCYLIRYFPIYTQPVVDIIRKVKDSGRKISITNDLLIRLVFVGPGPCPEVLGLLSIIKEYRLNINFEICLIDKYINSWKYSRKIAFDKLVLNLPGDGYTTVDTCESDFMDIEFTSKHSKEITESDIIIFQFCLNETVREKYKNVFDNIFNAVVNMKKNKLLVIIERVGYGDMVGVIKNLEKKLEKDGIAEIVFSIDHGKYEPSYHDIVNEMPDIITKNLLDGVAWTNANGRIPSRKVSYIFSVIKRM